jgi:hypothetical protein
MNDLDFGDMPFAGGTVADFCHRFPNSPACSHPTQPGFGSASSPIGGHHDNRHDGGNHHADGNGGGHGGNNAHHPLS